MCVWGGGGEGINVQGVIDAQGECWCAGGRGGGGEKVEAGRQG